MPVSSGEGASTPATAVSTGWETPRTARARTAHAQTAATKGRLPPGDVLPGLARGLGPAWSEGSGVGTPSVFPRPRHKKCRLQQACHLRPQFRFFLFRSERLLTPTPRAVVKNSQPSRTVCRAPQPVSRASSRLRDTGRWARAAPEVPPQAPPIRPGVSTKPRPGKRRRCFRGPFWQGRGRLGPDAPRKTIPLPLLSSCFPSHRPLLNKY